MKTLRLLLYGLLLLLALLAAAAAWFYPRLPALLERQGELYLRDYGADIELDSLQVSPERAGVGRLRLRGRRDGLAFDLVLTSLRANYRWRALLGGAPPALHIASARLSLTEEAGPGADDGGPLILSELLPRQLLAGLPLASLELSRLRLDYRPLAGPPVTVSGSLHWSGELSAPLHLVSPVAEASLSLRAGPEDPLELQIELRDKATPVAWLEAILAEAGVQAWEWDVRGELQHGALLPWLRRLQAQALAPLDLSAVAALEVEGSTVFQGRMGHPDQLQLAGADVRDLLAQFDLELQTDNSLAQLRFPPAVRELSGKAAVRLQLAAGRGELVMGPAALSSRIGTEILQLPEDTRQWLGWGESIPLRWRSPGDLRLAIDAPGGLSLQLSDNRLLLGEADSQLRMEGIIGDAAVDPAGKLALELAANLDARLRGQQLPRLQLDLVHRGAGERSEFDLALRDLAESLRLSATMGIDPETGEGSGTLALRSLDLPYAAGTVGPLLQQFGLLQEPLTVDDGSFSLNSELGFGEEELRATSKLRVAGLTGSYGEYSFEGVDLAADWRGVEQWQTLRPATLEVARLDVGFDITDTRALVTLPQPADPSRPLLRIEEFSSGMFGGRVFLPEPHPWDFGGDDNSLTLRVEGWQLEDLVALQQGQDIEARGVLEGELPVTVRGGRLIVDKGFLRARAPGGVIRYAASAAGDAVAASSPELGMALGLLEDFRYQVLSSEVNLDPAGNLLLGLSLEGSNPARYGGRSIRFNINLEQNLDPLLQSLRLSDSLVEKVEKRVN